MQLRTTFVVYLCIERSERGAKGTPRTLRGVPIFFIQKKKSPKQTNIINFDVSSLPIDWPNAIAELINGLKTVFQQLLQTQPVLSFPALFCSPLVRSPNSEVCSCIHLSVEPNRKTEEEIRVSDCKGWGLLGDFFRGTP